MHAAPQDLRKSRVNPSQTWPLWIAGLSSFVVVAWPAGDLLYRQNFDSPSVWWLVALIAIGAWVAVVVAYGQQKLMVRLDSLEEAIANYGDERESDGHQLATRVRATGHVVRQLAPVE